jgi:hypothetical protein
MARTSRAAPTRSVARAGKAAVGAVAAAVSRKAAARAPVPGKTAALQGAPPREEAASAARARFAALVARFVGHPGVDPPRPDARGWGALALRYHGKIFAMVDSRGRFVVKLSALRAAEIVTSAQGRTFEPVPGRAMKRWVSFDGRADPDWGALAKEALASAEADGQQPGAPSKPRRP